MNTEKLLRIIIEVMENEQKFNFQGDINEMLSKYEENNAGEVNIIKQRVFSNIETSELANYVNTELKVLKKINAYGYFDLSIITNINNILSMQSHEVIPALREFASGRASCFERMVTLRGTLEQLGLSQDNSEKNNYLVVFSLTQKYHNLDELQKSTKDIDLFLKYIAIAIDDDDSKKYELQFADNGCIEYFIHVSPVLAQHVASSLDIIIRIKDLIDCYNLAKSLHSKYSKNDREAADKIATKDLDEKKEKEINVFIGQLNIIGDEASVNDQKNSLRHQFIRMVKYFEEGVSIEVKTPRIEPPNEVGNDDTPATKKKTKELKEEYLKKIKIDEINRKIHLLQLDKLQLNFPEESAIDDSDN